MSLIFSPSFQGCYNVTGETLKTVKTYCPKLRYLGHNVNFYESDKRLLDTLPLLKLDSVFDDDTYYYSSSDYDSGDAYVPFFNSDD